MSDNDSDDGYRTDNKHLEKSLVASEVVRKAKGKVFEGPSVYAFRIRDVYSDINEISSRVTNAYQYWMIFSRFSVEMTRKECPRESMNRSIIKRLCVGWTRSSSFGDTYASFSKLVSDNCHRLEDSIAASEDARRDACKLFPTFALGSDSATAELVENRFSLLKKRAPEVVFTRLKLLRVSTQVSLATIEGQFRRGLLYEFLRFLMGVFRRLEDAESQAAGGSSSAVAPVTNGAASGGDPQVGAKRPLDGAAGGPLPGGSVAASGAAGGPPPGGSAAASGAAGGDSDVVDLTTFD